MKQNRGLSDLNVYKDGRNEKSLAILALIERRDIKDVIAFIEETKIDKLCEDTPTFEMTDPILDWARLHTEFYLNRYASGKGTHWTEGQERNGFVGLLGQKTFDVLCQLLEVPTCHNDPIYDWRKWKPYDFKIRNLGKIEVKTFDHYAEKLLVKQDEWHGNDLLVAFQLEDEEPTAITMKGWLEGNEVKNLPLAKKGKTKYSKYKACYIGDLEEDLNSSADLFHMLGQQSIPNPSDLQSICNKIRK